ncbi:MAG: hypothetical protein [Bacteriophage sp.]|nr:MAG: hypothetical protein [Bacteriophage sp.]
MTATFPSLADFTKAKENFDCINVWVNQASEDLVTTPDGTQVPPLFKIARVANDIDDGNIPVSAITSLDTWISGKLSDGSFTHDIVTQVHGVDALSALTTWDGRVAYIPDVGFYKFTTAANAWTLSTLTATAINSGINNLTQLEFNTNINNTKANAADVYTKAAADDIIADKVSKTVFNAFVNTTQAALNNKPEANFVYTKTETDTLLASKVAVADYNAEVLSLSNSIATKANNADLTATNTTVATKANAADVYTKAAADAALATHTDNTNNPHGVTKAQVGLGNVDNTSDLNKPISTATQTALNGKANSADVVANTAVGAPYGIAPLDANRLIPSAYLPSFVDDVLEYSTLTAFPTTGESGKIYVATDANRVYRWTGTVYIEITGSSVADAAVKLATPRNISATGDGTWSVSFDASSDVSAVFTLANIGIVAGTYPKVTVDAKGRVTAGAMLSSADLPAATTASQGAVVLVDDLTTGGTTKALTAEQGKTLQTNLNNKADISSVYAKTETIKIVSDYTALAAINNPYNGQIVYVSNKGIAGNFRYSQPDTQTPNGGTIIASNGGGNWLRVFQGEVQSSWFDSLQNFVNFVTSGAYVGKFEAKVYELTKTLIVPITSGFVLTGAGSDTIFKPASTFNGNALIAVTGQNKNVVFKLGRFSVTRGSNTTVQRGIQIGKETDLTIINGLAFSNVYEVSIDSFPTNWALCHARMITFDNCSGWNQPNDTAGENLLIYQNGYFTGDMVFNQCQFVATYQKNKSVNIQSNHGVYDANNGNNSVCGLKFNNCDIYSGNDSFNVYVGSGSYAADIWLNGVQIDQQQDNGFKFVADGIGSLIQDIHIHDSYVSKSNNNQIGFVAQNSGTIADIWVVSNQIINVLNNGINLYRDSNSTLKDIHVNNNSFPDPNTTSSLIEFNGAIKFTCAGNHITDVFGQSTAKTVVNIEQGCDNFTVFGNNDDNHTTSGTIIDLSGDVKKAIFGNAGYNPILAQNIVVGASPFSFKNTTGAPIVVAISGGTVSDIKLSSGIGDLHFTPTGNTQVTVPQGQITTVVYSAVPNMYMYGV